MKKTLFSLACCSFLLVGIVAAQSVFHDLNAGLIKAAREGDAVAVQAALDAGAGVNASADQGVPALMAAAREGRDVNARDTIYGATALMMASNSGYTDMVKLLLEKGADVNAKDTKLGTTALWVAAANGHADIVKLLLAAKADINVVVKLEGNDHTPLSMAKEREHAQVISLLQEAGAKE